MRGATHADEEKTNCFKGAVLQNYLLFQLTAKVPFPKGTFSCPFPMSRAPTKVNLIPNVYIVFYFDICFAGVPFFFTNDCFHGRTLDYYLSRSSLVFALLRCHARRRKKT